MRSVLVKSDIMEVGVGSIEATLITETDPDESGAFVHLAKTEDGRYFLSITDMEMFNGSYWSVEVKADNPWIKALESIPFPE